MASFTPGPWKVRNDGAVNRIYAPTCAGVSIGYTTEALVSGIHGSYSVSKDEDAANARMMAAAPELLMLAHQYLSDMIYPVTNPGSRSRRIEAIEAALAKAEGK